MEINERLKRADYGEDYVPVDPASMLVTNLELNVRFSEDMKVMREGGSIERKSERLRNVLSTNYFVLVFIFNR